MTLQISTTKSNRTYYLINYIKRWVKNNTRFALDVIVNIWCVIGRKTLVLFVIP